jgi:hypothetical protein
MTTHSSTAPAQAMWIFIADLILLPLLGVNAMGLHHWQCRDGGAQY